MKIMALDSSGLVASVAIVRDGCMTAEYTVNYKKTHSQTLLPMLDEIVTMCEINMEDMDAIAITKGPGSFTGLRIGAATAKGLGLALKKPLIPIPTTAGLAYNLYGTGGVICPILDARRGQVYTGIYEFEAVEAESAMERKYQMKVIQQQQPTSMEEQIAVLNEIGREVTFLGDGVEVFAEVIRKQMTTPFSFAPPHNSKQRAGAVAALAEEYYHQGILQTAEEHQPDYLRLSQAERERNQAQAGTGVSNDNSKNADK